MAETLLNVLAEELLSRALSLAADRLSRLWGVKEDLETLAEKVKMIQSLLSDAEGKCTTNTVQVWLARLRTVSFDAGYLLDEFAYEVQRKKFEKWMPDKVCNIFSSSNPLFFRWKMASEIRKINLKFEKIFKDTHDIGLRPIEISNSPIDFRKRQRITDPFLAGLDIVGRDDEVKNIVTELTSSKDKKDLEVIGIVGMAGQGKTAVAKLVYNEENVVKHFEKRIWVCVSENFDTEKLLNDMIQSLKRIESKLTVRQAIVDELKKELSAKRFLLVLDDIWNEEQELWNRMRTCLLEIGGLKGSKIIVTTRSDKVVTIMQGLCIHLGKLSDEYCWMLFEKIAYAEGGAVKTEQLVNIGKRIVKRCGGLPLAIKAIAGLLYSKRHEQEWLKIEKNDIWDSSEAVFEVSSIIKISYDHLPSLSLKQCFVYCSLFPKDFVMEREQLLQLWMAQGFLNSEGQRDMEEVGDEYFNILWQKSLLQDVTLNAYGNIISCKMHDVVHDFALKASMGYCLIIQDEKLNDDIKIVHLWVNLKREISLNASGEGFLKLRTLILSGGIFGDVLLQLKCLRTLVVQNKDVKEFPKPIEKLKHLRHLDIYHTSISKLPNSVTKFYNLLTLRLYKLEQLPKSFKNLVNLRHLYIQGDCDILLPKIGQLTSLRTLPFFRASKNKGCQIEELGNLQKLEGTLRIYDLQNVGSSSEASKANLSRKANIESLELHWKSEAANEDCNHKDVLEGLEPHSNLKSLTIENYGGENLPSWMMMGRSSRSYLLRNLVEMKLENLMNCEQLPPLGHLRCLKIVEINEMQRVKRIEQAFYGWMTTINPNRNETEGASSSSQSSISVETSSSTVVLFPSLQELVIKGMPNLEEWSDPSLHSSFSVKVLPHLTRLQIEDCRSLARLPDMVLRNLFSLRELCIHVLGKLSNLPSNIGGLSSLKELSIHASNLESMPDIGGLRSLRYLSIYSNKLIALPSGLETLTSTNDELDIILNSAVWMESIRCLTNLRSLTLRFSEDLDYIPWPSKIETKYFVSLESLTLHGTPNLKSLPDQIQYLPALRKLWLFDFNGMEALPEWMGNILSLQHLWLLGCNNLKYLPSANAMQRGLTNLSRLNIIRCPTLSERCQRGSGSEWHKIARIPTISIDYNIIQSPN